MWPHDSNCIGIRICILSPSVTWDQNWAARQSVGDGSHYFRSISRLFTREDLRKGPLSNSPTQGNVTLAVDKVSQRKLQTTFHNVDFKNFPWTCHNVKDVMIVIICTHDMSSVITHDEKSCIVYIVVYIFCRCVHGGHRCLVAHLRSTAWKRLVFWESGKGERLFVFSIKYRIV